ncbi:protein phosphatase 2C 51-like isoform X2 [Diospyros lotus]|uniref:protein phosphatase 2C 51-like isoform X2 n=1 Tax=Diospyros lotus TaxID=55363 RepID=UPI00225AF24C|nr:protein phosphatase 2C 51-like isoform X2 [Diospyros lotus]
MRFPVRPSHVAYIHWIRPTLKAFSIFMPALPSSAILFESSSLIAFPRSSYGIGIALLPLFYLMTTGLRRDPPSAAVGALRGIALSRSGVMCRYSVRRAQARRKRLEIRRLELSSQVAGGGGKVISSEKYSKNTESESRKRDSDLSESKNSAEKRVSELSLSYSSSSETDVVFPRIEAMKSWRSITCLPHGSVSMIGRRSEMEDAVRVEPGFLASHSRVYDFFGVYDGHGGSRVAQACRDRLHRLLKEEIEEIGTFESTSLVDWEKVMVACFEKMDEEVNDNRKGSTALSETIGSTAVVAVVGAEVVVVANCGDSRAVLSREGVAVSMSNDHKPDRPDELERIEGAGGRVINWNGHRVLGVLATSRSIGQLFPLELPYQVLAWNCHFPRS